MDAKKIGSKYWFFSCLQVTPYCGPGEEDCVSNQTLKDESCLVSCSGLYADIADDSSFQQSRQNTLKGIAMLNFNP